MVDALFGLLGGILPGGLHMAWNFTRGSKSNSGTIDLTLTKKPLK